MNEFDNNRDSISDLRQEILNELRRESLYGNTIDSSTVHLPKHSFFRLFSFLAVSFYPMLNDLFISRCKTLILNFRYNPFK